MPATAQRIALSLRAREYDVKEDASIKTERPAAREMEVISFFDVAASANTHNQRQWDLIKDKDRSLFRCIIDGVFIPDFDGETPVVSLAFDRGLPAGRDMLIARWSIDITRAETDLLLWG